MYFTISTFINTSYACDCETVVKYLTVDISVPGAKCGSYCTYNNVLYFYNRWNSNNTEAINATSLACQGGTWAVIGCYPAQGTLRYQCVAYCCYTSLIACVVTSKAVVKPRIPCEKTGVQVAIPCVAQTIGC